MLAEELLDGPTSEIVEALEAYDFEEPMAGISTLDDLKEMVREVFQEKRNGLPICWEDLAALAVVGVAKGL